MAENKNLKEHERFMCIALALAARSVGDVAPNPAVAALIVKNGKIISRGVTAKGGRPHAETIAISKAGKDAKGATIYVTLEPCSHFGKTPPCAEGIIKGGISRVVVAAIDPYEKVNGKGISMLKKAGLHVITGVLEKEALQINRGFIKRVRENRPFVTLKLAASIDGKIASSVGDSKWITSPESRNYAHLLRAKNDAILVGIGTVLKDDPELTCRLSGLEGRSPIRVILDSKLQMPIKSKIAKSSGKTRTIIFYKKASKEKIAALKKLSIEPINLGDMKIKNVLQELGNLGINNLLVEGGAKVAASFIKENLVDEMILICGPKIIGGDGVSAIDILGSRKISDAKEFSLYESRKIGDDLIKTYVR